jgi:hypothetical protein
MLTIAAAGLAALWLPAFAQQDKRVRRIGYFGGGSLQSSAAWLAAFRQGMAELRWVEGRDYVMMSATPTASLRPDRAWPPSSWRPSRICC